MDQLMPIQCKLTGVLRDTLIIREYVLTFNR